MTPLYADVALRTSDVLGDFASVFVLPVRYGNLSKTSFTLGKINDTLYFAADHVMQDITKVFESGQEIKEWRWFTMADRTGRMGTYVELKQPASADNSAMTASGFGKVSSLTGLLIENPADVLQDIAALNGRVLSFPLFKQACGRKGLKVASSLNEIKGLRLYAKELLGSIGALWVSDNVVFSEEVDSYIEDVFLYGNGRFNASADNQAGIIKVAFNYNEGTGKYASFLEVGAKGSKYTNTRVVYCKWLRDNATALSYGEELCRFYAGEHYLVNAEVGQVVRNGARIRLLNSLLGDFPILVSEARPLSSGTSITGIMSVTLWDKVRLLSYSAEIPQTQKEGIELDFTNGILTITIYKQDNSPFVGAFVSLDKGSPKVTDSNGKVKFTTTQGGHVLDIAAVGFDSISNLPIQVQ